MREMCVVVAQVKLGWVTGTKSEPEVVLSSRLVPLTDVFMRRKIEDLKDASSQEMKDLMGTYILQKWLVTDEDVRASSKAWGRDAQAPCEIDFY